MKYLTTMTIDIIQHQLLYSFSMNDE